MDAKDREALEFCFPAILRDLEVTSSFLEHLVMQRVITSDQRDQVHHISSRNAKVTMLVQILKRRAGKAFDGFRDELRKEHSWLADSLEGRRQQIASGNKTSKNLESVHAELVIILNCWLLPLLYRMSDQHHHIIRAKDDPTETLRKMSELLQILPNKILRVLGHPEVKHIHAPLHVLISEHQRNIIKKVKGIHSDESSMKEKTFMAKIERLEKKAVKLESEKQSLKALMASKLKAKDKLINDAKKEMKRNKAEIEDLKRKNSKLEQIIEAANCICI